tara:strand:- start:1406 stop:3034 length:1629 start_codon:yes stop_codon:yes gene_type:complete
MKKYKILLSLILFISCNNNDIVVWENYDESGEIKYNSNHPIDRMRYKRIQSLTSDRNNIFKPFKSFLKSYDTVGHNSLKKYILNKDIQFIQSQITNGNLNYEKLVKFFIYRIYRFEMDRELYLNSIISLNPDIIDQARRLDKSKADNLLYGMPILVKDNINVQKMITSAGASVFNNNMIDEDAHVIKKLKENNILILGKLNMSEWAYYFCRPCPVGYSSIGGQTLNPYGRKLFESGGSSSGSGVSIAANFAVASLGSETSGSILSPSSKNSLVGLKPTIGAVSRNGIVPISSFYDTAGPMTTNVYDNALVFNSMIGVDKDDTLSFFSKDIDLNIMENFDASTITVGFSSRSIPDSVFNEAIKDLKLSGVKTVEYNPKSFNLPFFRNILTSDMKRDLPKYISEFANRKLTVKNVKDIVEYNNEDSFLHAPYNQYIFNEIISDTINDLNLDEMKKTTKREAGKYLNKIMDDNNFDVFISVDNSMAGIAAAAHFPALTVPMGYREDGQPTNITFISRSFNEQLLYNLAFSYEKQSKKRKTPKKYN